MKKLIYSLLIMSISMVQAKVQRLQDVFKGVTSIEKPFELRDPFKKPLFKKQSENQAKTKKIDGVYSNVASLSSSVPVEKIRILGVLIGKERRAVVSTGGKETFLVKEGMMVGNNRAEVKAIVPGGIILVEKVVNIYGITEYLETVIPISK